MKRIRRFLREPGGSGSTIRGLIVKDALMMAGSERAYLIACVIWSIMPGPWIRIMGICFVAMISVSTMLLDERNRWERFVLALPVKRRDVVLSKYALGFLCLLAFLFISRTLGKIGEVFTQLPMGRKEMLLIAQIGLLLQASILPFQFRHGPTRGRFAQMLLYPLVMAVYFSFERTGVWSRIARQIPVSWLLVAGLGVAAIYGLSICLSVKWYQKRSF